MIVDFAMIIFGAQFYWVNKKGREFYDMGLPWKKIVMMAALAFVCYGLLEVTGL